MMPDPTTLAPVERGPHRTILEREPDVAAWDGLHSAESDCDEAEAALRCVDAADNPLGHAFAVAAARAATAHGWVAYATLTAAQDDAGAPGVHAGVYAVATARRCVVCDQPDTGAAA